MKSAVNAERFFFSPHGRFDPLVEMQAAISAFENQAIVGTQKQPAGCVFPARKRVLEKLLERRFPESECPDLRAWIKNIDADEVRLVFAGAYAANPGSILGHTFLRLSNSRREASGREGVDLLSYSVGFQAIVDGSDNRLSYMLKGLFGGYDGSYEIEKHYIKVGLYNNSEARDLWETKIDITGEEVDLLVEHFWELSFNASLSYYFVDENCSYRLITLLEAVRPEIDVSRKLAGVVLPAETVRAMQEQGWARPDLGFRASIRRRMNLKLALLSDEQIRVFESAKTSLTAVDELNDSTAYDALLDFWLFENYRDKGSLPAERRLLMERAFVRAAELKEPTRFLNDQVVIRRELGLKPPFSGHKSRWLYATVGARASGSLMGVGYRSGVHPLAVVDAAYEDVAAIEYLGADLELRGGEVARWDLLLLKVDSIENWLGPDGHPSWKVEIKAANRCLLCQSREPQLQMAFAGGVSLRRSRWSLFSLAAVKAVAWTERDSMARPQGVLAPGVAIGSRLALFENTGLVANVSQHWWRELTERAIESRLQSMLRVNHGLFASVLYEGLEGRTSENTVLTGWLSFF